MCSVNRSCVCARDIMCVAVCCSVLQCVAVCCSVLQCGAVWCSVLQCGVAVWCCSVVQCCSVRVNRPSGCVRGILLHKLNIHTAPHCNKVQHTATHKHTGIFLHMPNTNTAPHCTTLQHTATRCNSTTTYWLLSAHISFIKTGQATRAECIVMSHIQINESRPTYTYCN